MDEGAVINSVKAVYDNQKKQFVKAYVNIDGKTEVWEDSQRINDALVALKKQKGVSKLKDLPRNVVETIFVYDAKKAKEGEFVANPHLDGWLEREERRLHHPILFSRKTAYVGGIVTAAALTAFVGCANSMAKKSSYDGSVTSGISTALEDSVEEEQEQEESNVLVAPTTWEDYMSDKYENNEQKQFFKRIMDELIVANVKETTIDGEQVKYTFTPEQAFGFSLYYDSNLYTYEQILQIIGDYPITYDTLAKYANEALDIVICNWSVAESKDEMMTLKVQDEEVQKLLDKYRDLVADFKFADSKDKANKKQAIEDALNDDFINGATAVIDLQEHPAAHALLSMLPNVMNGLGSSLDKGINEMIIGSIGQNGIVTDGGTINGKAVDQKAYDQQATDGMLNLACAVYISYWDGYQDFYNNAVQTEKFADFTKSTFELTDHNSIEGFHEGVIFKIMNDYYVSLGVENLDTEAVMDRVRQSFIKKLQDQKINNPGKFDPVKNPAGGKKGDTYTGETKRVESEDPSKLGIDSATKEKAEDQADDKAGITEHNAQEDAKKAEIAKVEASQDAITNYYAEKGPNAPEYNSSWANSNIAGVRTIYNAAKERGINRYNKAQQQTVTDKGADQTPEHSQNPNQNGSNQNTNPQPTQPAPEQSVVPSTPETPAPGTSTQSGSTSSDKGADQTPDHSQNPNQNGAQQEAPQQSAPAVPEAEPSYSGGSTSGSVDIIDDDNVIEGTVTTDGSDVDDLSQYGSMGIQADVYIDGDSIITTYIDHAAADLIEEMANNPVQEEESQMVLVK